MKLLAPLLAALLAVTPTVLAAPPKMLLQMGHDTPATVMAISPDGRWLVTGDPVGGMRMWSLATGDLWWNRSEASRSVESLLFTSNSRSLIVGRGGGIEELQVTTGDWLRTIRRPDGVSRESLRPLTLTPDDKSLWCLTSAGTLQCLDFKTRKMIRELKLLQPGYQAVDQRQRLDVFPSWALAGRRKLSFLGMAPDGSLFAMLDAQGRIQIWENTTGRQRVLLGPVKSHDPILNKVTAAAFSPDGQVFGVGQMNGALSFWDTRSGRKIPLDRFALHLLSRDTGTGDLVDNTRPNAPIRGITSIGLSRDLKHVVAGIGMPFDGLSSANSQVIAAYTSNGQPVAVQDMVPRGGTVKCVTVSPDGQTLVSSDDENTIRLWGTPERKIKRTLARSVVDVDTLRLAPDGRSLVTGSVYEPACVWDLATGGLKHLLGSDRGRSGYSGASNLIAYASRPDILAVSGVGVTIDLWNPLTGLKAGRLSAETNNVAGNSTITALGGAASSLALAAGSEDGTVRVWNRQDSAWKLQKTLPPIADLGAIAVSLSADGKTLTTAGSFGGIDVWDSGTGKLRRSLPLPQSRDWEGSFSPDGKLLAQASQTALEIWDLTVGKRVRAFPMVNAWAASVVFWPDDKWVGLANGFIRPGAPSALKIYELNTGRLIRDIKDWPRDAFGADFSGDGSRLAVATRDKSVQIREARDGHLLATLVRLPANEDLRLSTNWLAYTPEGYYAASPGGLNFIRWRAGSEVLPEVAFHKELFRPDLVAKALNPMPGKKLKQ